MKRLIEDKLLRWKENSKNKALLITGARQVGKTYIVRDFGDKHYKSFVEINFLENEQAKKLFEGSTTSKDILLYISAFAGDKLVKGETLIFLDEVQECPNIVTAIKFLVEEGSYNYILSGSLLGIEMKNVKSLPVGYMDIVEMYPMNFEEFCFANEVSANVIDHLKNAFDNITPIDDILHEKFISLYNLYLIVGGMPACVKKYIETNNLKDVLDEQYSISAMYRQDIAKYDANDKLYIENIYDLIPSELNSQSKRFTVNDLKNGIKFDRTENGFLWLTNAGVAIATYCANEPKFPLLMSKSRNLLKLFMCDVGLLSSMYLDNVQIKILNKEKDINNGAIFENAVAQELKCNGLNAYYYKNNRIGELDFLIEQDGEVVPIEVKSGKDYTVHSALNNLMESKEYNMKKAYILSTHNIKREGKKIYLPIYMAMFIKKSEMQDMIYKVDISGLKTI